MNLSDNIFSPSSIAIVGVSENPQKVGHIVASNMQKQRFSGKLYFINPKGVMILGQKTFVDLKSINKKIDLVVLAIPAAPAVDYIDEIAEIGCKNIVLYAAGFKENHTEKTDLLDNKLSEKLQKYEINLLGPNCIGYINTSKKINTTFLTSIPDRGNISIISQSGALGSALLDYIVTKPGFGISHFISLGNKLDIDETDCLLHLKDDSKTTVIGIYLEDVDDGERFVTALDETTKQKPVIILKSGRSKEGSSAAKSHTGSMIVDDGSFTSAVRQAGAIRVETYAEFEMLLKLYSLDTVPKNKNVLVLSNAGGMGVLLVDELISNGLKLVTISKDTMLKLGQSFGELKKISVHNPIDLLGDASAFDYEKAVNLTLSEKDIGAVIVLLTPQATTEIAKTARVLEKMSKTFHFKQIYPIFMGKGAVRPAHKIFEEKKMASFRYFSALPKALKKMIDANEVLLSRKISLNSHEMRLILAKNKLNITEILSQNKKNSVINMQDSLKLLSLSGIVTAKLDLMVNDLDIDDVIKKFGFPVVAKIASGKISHKTEVKGVVTGIENRTRLAEVFSKFLKIPGSEGCYIQKQYSGHELIIGAKRDKTFGTVVIVGLGGIYAELFDEIIQFVYPFSISDLNFALKNTKLLRLTKNFRNMTPIDIKELFNFLVKVGTLVDKYPQIKEIDINPIIVSERGMVAVDARVVV